MTRADAWRSIRTLRARPPGLAAGDAERRAVFGAAIQQTEELFAASAAVSPASKPLPLFYALSQAGRAIAAAHNPEEGWKITTHGLSVRAGNRIGNAVVTPIPSKRRSDAFTAVATALRSEALEGPVTVSALWAALPELADFTHVGANAAPALEIRLEGGRYPHLFSPLHPAAGTVFLIDVANDEELRSRLSLYAHTDGCEAIIGPLPGVGRLSQATLRWPAEPSPESTPGTKAVRALHDVATRVGDRWFLQPLLGSPPTAPKPLLTWWALLIGLSSLARYHPAEWTAALDVDKAPTAVDLEEGLAIAERRLPQLVARAIEPLFRAPGSGENGD